MVDDDEAFLGNLSDSLQQQYPQFKIKTASSGVHACTLLGSYLPDLLVLDLRMPGMDGTEIIQFLEKDSRYSRIQVIVMTGLDEEDPSVHELQKKRNVAFLFKPFKVEDLAKSISSVMQRRKTKDSSTQAVSAGQHPTHFQSGDCDLKDYPLFDVKDALNRLGIHVESLRAVLEIFLDTSASDLDGLRQGVQNHNFDNVSQLAHRVKGAAGNVGAACLQHLAISLESAAKSKNGNQMNTLFAEIDRQMIALKNHLAEFNWDSLK